MINKLLQQSFFRLLSEYSQRKVSASEFVGAVEELAIHVANLSINKAWHVKNEGRYSCAC